MLTDEFKSTVTQGNILRTRIMLKDSLIVDPSTAQFSEMFNYAKVFLKELLVPFDNGYLEEDSLKWNIDTMNREMVELVNNFSSQRITHLKKVITKIRAGKIKEITEGRSASLKQIHANTFKIHKIYSELRVREGDGIKIWSPDDITNLEKAAQSLLKAIHEYRKV